MRFTTNNYYLPNMILLYINITDKQWKNERKILLTEDFSLGFFLSLNFTKYDRIVQKNH